MSTEENLWKKCNSCKKPIEFNQKYWVCNVSTCNRKRTGLSFCTVSCWDAHVPMMNHRESWAEERKAPSREQWQRILNGEDDPAAPTKAKAKPVLEEKLAQPAQSSAPKVILRKPRSD